MKYNIEYQAAEAVKGYLTATLDAADFTSWPIVTWFDPMAIDDASRVVCICQSATSHETGAGNFSADVEVGVRTNWNQPTVQADMASHFDRVAQVRDVLNDDTDALVAGIAAQCAAGFTVSFVNVRREYATEVNEGNYYSSVKLSIECHATTE